MGGSLVIIGASARAAAQSAVRAGYSPWCADLYADRDLQRIAPVKRCARDAYPFGLLKLIESAPAGPVMYTGAIENHPKLIEAIALQRTVFGCSAQSVRACRDPGALAALPPAPGLKLPKAHGRMNLVNRLGQTFLALWAGNKRYLLKPVASAGGAGIAFWSPIGRVRRGHYLQRYVQGLPISAIFHSDGWSARLMGISEQLIGEPGFGARGFQFVGNIMPVQIGDKARQAMMHLGVQIAQRCDLRGLFGIDMVLDYHGNVWPIEVNPRYTASVELHERAAGAAMLDGNFAPGRPTGRYLGKAFVYARAAMNAPDLYQWFDENEVADVPAEGEAITAGQPVCTVFAEGASRDDCLRRLEALANRIYTGGQQAP